jgi:hypothetical protein
MGILRSGFAAVLVSLLVVSPASATVIDLGLSIDGSSSINDTEWNTMRVQAANAIRGLSTAGNVQLSVTKFSFEAHDVIAPTVVTLGNRETLASTVQTMSRPTTSLGPTILASIPTLETLVGSNLPEDYERTGGEIVGGTNIEDAIEQTTALMFSLGENDHQFLNILTDGNATVLNTMPDFIAADVFNPLNAGDLAAAAAAFSGDPETAAVAARNAAITAGVDLISFEAIGFEPADLSFMLNSLAYPQPGVLAPGFPPPPPDANAKGFVVPIADFNSVEDALQAKFSALGIVPEPHELVLLGLGLTALATVRRRRA